ncbi:interleukin-17C-like [Trematomus bernacchii]|uniref:interleukin-17C-like n=1 Tax=Trematomus bernacchii TaxID=40690 RepID=UPI001469A1AB|nr:interleukin-17C-like [Trematomus bernacchii]XP_033988760.1 interleukin-17C-like [Trematomus bernacchii]
MDIKQILLFGLLFGLLAPGWSLRSNRCLPEQDLEEAAKRELSHFQGPPQNQEPLGPSYSCPVEMFTQQPPTHLKDRSLSPWGYILETMEDHFPSTYYRAQCLCTGCVLIQNSKLVESHDYNSARVVQSRVFLKKELCRDKKKYRLKPVRVEVAVGCTCTRANSTP